VLNKKVETMMIEIIQNVDELCFGCVYYPPNLPEQAYQAEDWQQLQTKSCSFEFLPDDKDCKQSRKTSCSLVDM
jgi:hypothetical protein